MARFLLNTVPPIYSNKVVPRAYRINAISNTELIMYYAMSEVRTAKTYVQGTTGIPQERFSFCGPVVASGGTQLGLAAPVPWKT